MSDKQKKVTHRTPVGTASFPWLNQPDTKFNDDGVYKVDLVVPAAEAANLMAMLDAEVEKAQAAYVEKDKKVAKTHTVANPYHMELDDEGDETGNVVFRFKQNAIIRRQGKPDIKVTIPLFDAKGQPSKAKVGGGSQLKVAFTIRPYKMDSTKQIGLTLDIAAVQIIELVTFGQRDAAGFGFGEEDGYSAEGESDESGFGFGNESEDEQQTAAAAPGEADF